MSLKKFFIDFLFKISTPSKIIFLVVSIIDVAGYWYYSYEQNLWLKIVLILLTTYAYLWLVLKNEYQLISLLNIYLITRNLYFAYVDSYLDFKPLLILCFISSLIIVYFSLEVQKIKGESHLLSHSWVYTLFGALTITQLFLLLSYWNNVPRPTKAILITITYYFLIRTIDIEDENDFNLKKLVYLLILTVILLVTIIYSISWKEI